MDESDGAKIVNGPGHAEPMFVTWLVESKMNGAMADISWNPRRLKICANDEALGVVPSSGWTSISVAYVKVEKKIMKEAARKWSRDFEAAMDDGVEVLYFCL